MSFFLVYFESNNASSTDYKGFLNVGKFHLPSNIFAGDLVLTSEERQYAGQLVSDSSRQCVNNMFLKNERFLRDELLEFIRERLRNSSVVSNLVGFVLHDENQDLLVTELRTLSIEQLTETFSRDLFGNGRGIRVVM